MSVSVRFLHTADLHLGIPVQGFSRASRDLEARLMDASFQAWKEICDAALHLRRFVWRRGFVPPKPGRPPARCLQEGVSSYRKLA